MIERATAELGEPIDGFPSWEERVVHVWTNRARADPATDLQSCSVCAEKACYSPRPPLVWNHDLGRAARFHSENLSRNGCGLQHDSPCTIVTDIDLLYTPGTCQGEAACACVPGTFACRSVGTSWTTRIGYFGGDARAENIAAGLADPVSTFYLWLHEPDGSSACGWRSSNGHRANILGGAVSIGVGKSPVSATYTQDFGGSGTPSQIVSGVHYPRTGSNLAFRANWYGASAPRTAMVSVGGTCTPLALERGTSTNGTYLANATVPSGCTRYVFHFTDSAGADVFYPTTGAYGIGCTTDWDPIRPAPCGPCTPDCTGRSCGDDGCGGSCGGCTGGLTCNASGTCACAGMTCGGSCVDTSSDESNCGACGTTCDVGDACIGGTCRCSPSCTGKVCGDDGCGGSCGICSSDRACDGSGQCECATGTSCRGACTDTMRDRRNCGACNTRCRGREFCVAGMCTRSCTPSCAGRVCGDDGCGGSCGNCGGGHYCTASGSCACPSGQAECGSTCVDTSSDPAHCGGCDRPCGGGETCISGACSSACLPLCGGRACGPDGCGGECGMCAADRACDGSGACVCGGASADCGGGCIDVSSDPTNCGACGRACGAEEPCVGGRCLTAGVPDASTPDAEPGTDASIDGDIPDDAATDGTRPDGSTDAGRDAGRDGGGADAARDGGSRDGEAGDDDDDDDGCGCATHGSTGAGAAFSIALALLVTRLRRSGSRARREPGSASSVTRRRR